ncbi:formyltransferase family protein [Thalassospira alkalitolerans]|uniref:formyltransferase family protein n=1 Tax=Thalassospira alkalitolerans TaxID=1293890 RepID=UPI0030EB2EDB|tara:strand:- start:44210 stop:45010 length:801 start_codon:yes stop_codon:yes gene_type:complete
MKVGILTTDTLHHRFFVQKLAQNLPENCEISMVALETKSYPWLSKAKKFWRCSGANFLRGAFLNPYLQPRFMDKWIYQYEFPRFFPDAKADWPENIPRESFHSINSKESCEFLENTQCDIFFVFGTGLIAPEIFSIPPLGAINAHGGLLPDYRGLDTNLWAAFLGRPDDMYITIHSVERDFDTGGICAIAQIPMAYDLSLVSLRYYTTRKLLELALEVLPKIDRGTAVFTPQPKVGRYFGPLPFLKKLIANRNIKRFARLHADGAE